MNIFKAKDLRCKEGLGKVPDDRPGWYRWWAPELALKYLLGEAYNDILHVLTKGEGELDGLCCIYVGVAIKESLRKRLNWHINQKHADSNIKSGALSTLRQTISSLVGKSQGDERATNDLIDLLTVECFPVDLKIKSDEAKAKIKSIEDQEIDRNALPLNIRGNRRPEVSQFNRDLTDKRKIAKQAHFAGKKLLAENEQHAK